VKVNQNGNLNFNTVTKSQNAQRNILSGKVIKLIFTDADGYSKELYLAENNNMSDYFELPPVPPNSVSDIRFVDNKYVGDLNKENFVQLNSVKFPVKIEIESNEDLKANLTVEDIQSGKIYSLNSSQVIINSKVELLKIKSETLPTSFKVFQNYPNPFNYQTVVRYEIPVNGNVQISLFNSLGQKVKVVKYDQVSAGIYSENISFDNLPSGVYFIEVNFNSTVSRIKCLFVK